jgi:hypothetical protein
MRKDLPGTSLVPLTLSLLLAGGLITSASAASGDEDRKKKKAKDHTTHLEADDPAESDAEAAARPATLKGMQVYVEPKDGKMRAPTREEEKALADEIAKLTNRSTEGLVAVTYPDGTIGLDLQGRFLNVAVVHLEADGTLKTECVTNPPPPVVSSVPAVKPSPRPLTKPSAPEVWIER